MHRMLRRLIAAIAVALPAALLTGCVASEQAAYLRQLNAIVEPGPAASDDVAVAFALGEYAPGRDNALAIAEGDAPPD